MLSNWSFFYDSTVKQTDGLFYEIWNLEEKRFEKIRTEPIRNQISWQDPFHATNDF